MKYWARMAAYGLLANAAIWIFVSIDLARRLVPYEAHTPAFEEELPLLVIGRRALPISEMHTNSLKILKVAQAPSFLAVRPLVHLMNKNPVIWDQIFWRMSAWSYLLIVVVLLSFVQWYLISQFAAWILPPLWRSLVFNLRSSIFNLKSV